MLSPTDILGLAEQIVQAAESIKARCDAIKNNPRSAEALLNSCVSMASQLRSLAEHDRDTLNHFRPHHREGLEAEIENIGVQVTETIAKLHEKKEKLDRIQYAVSHAMRNEARFAALERKVARETAAIRRIRDTLALAERMDRMLAYSGGSVRRDVFRACVTAPKNPERITMDFESKCENGEPATCEGRLKAILLQDSSSRSVGAIAEGMSGLGKTCTLRALAADRDVRARFPGGIYFMGLGADADTGRVIKELCDSVEASGGKILAAELRGEGRLDHVIRKVRGWFAGHTCLFVFDDLWRSKDIGEDILVEMSVLVSHGGDDRRASALLYSTRDKSLSEQGSTVPFEARDPFGEIAKKILLNSAGADPAEINNLSCTDAIFRILEKCGGLPVILNLCGTTARQIRASLPGNEYEAWKILWDNLTANDLVTQRPDNYGSLDAALLVALKFLDDHSSEAKGMPCPLSFREMHRALCLLAEQDWVPLSVLKRLWKLQDDKSAEIVLKCMIGVGVAQAEYREIEKGVRILGLRLHDLVLNFAQYEARKNGEALRWYDVLLNGYSNGIQEQTDPALWPQLVDSTEDGGYMFRNICRLLQGAGRLGELGQLLHNAEWVAKVLDMGAILLFERDLETYLQCVAALGEESRLQLLGQQDEDFEDSLKRVCKITRLCLPYCSRNNDEKWFQLYARLKGTENRSPWVDKMLTDAQRHAPKPWLQVVWSCLKGADDSLVDNFLWSADVLCVELVNETNIVSLGRSREHLADVYLGEHLSSGESKTSKLSWAFTETPSVINEAGVGRPQRKPGERKGILRSVGQMVSTSWFQSLALGCGMRRSKHGLRIATENDVVVCGTVFRDGSSVVTGWRSGVLKVSDSRTGALRLTIEAHTGSVRGVAVHRDGDWIVSGSDDCTIRVWDTSSGLQLGEPFTGHSDAVTCVAVSGNGSRIVSGSGDKTVRVWDLQSRQPICEALAGHTSVVMSLSVSEDGERVASGSYNGIVRVWDVSSGIQVSEPLTGHTDRVSSVALSRDGRLLVSGSFDCTLRLWDVLRGQQLGTACSEHMGPVVSIVVSEDGERIISGSSGSVDNTVRVWNVQRLLRAKPALAENTERLSSVAVSQDRKTVVSGSYNGNVRLWDVSAGRQICAPLGGHTDRVNSVAISADGRRVFSGSSDMAVRVWDLSGGQQVVNVLTAHKGPVRSVAASHDGKWVVSGSSDKVVWVWDFTRGRPVEIALTGHKDMVRNVAMSRDGTRAASYSNDRTFRLWDVRSGMCLRVIQAKRIEGQWDSLLEEIVEPSAGARLTQRVPQEPTFSIVADCNRLLFYRQEMKMVLATFESEIVELLVDVQHRVLVTRLQSGIVNIALIEA